MKTRSAWMGSLILAVIAAQAVPAWAEETAPPTLLGAEALIAKIQSELADAPASAQPGEDPARTAYRAKREAFLQSRDTPPLPAADGWLELAEQFWMLPPPPPDQNPYGYSSGQDVDPLSFSGLVAAIPPPEAWPLVLAKLEAAASNAPPEDAARNAILRAAYAFLNHDPTRLKAALESLGQQKAGLESYQKEHFRDQMRELEKWVAVLDERDDDIATRFEQELKMQSVGNRYGGNLAVPDLVIWAGPERAEALLRKALAVAGLQLEISGEATLRLAQTIALSQLDSLPSPQWALVDTSPDGLALFEGLSRKFAQPADEETPTMDGDIVMAEVSGDGPSVQGWNDYRFQQDYAAASVAYLFGLLIQNRTEDALKQALALKENNVSDYTFASAMEKHPEVPAATRLSFFGLWLEAKPELPLWDTYVQLATAANRTDEASQLLDRTAAREDLTFLQRFEVQCGKSQLLLALDRAEEAVALWRTLADLSAENELPLVQTQLETRKILLAESWAAMALALKQTNWFDEALTLGDRSSDRLSQLQPDSPHMYSGSGSLLDGLLELGRFGEAEQRAETALVKLIDIEKLNAGPMGQPRPVNLYMPFTQLVEIYSKAGRPADVLALFEKSPGWGTATNLAELAPIFHVPVAEALQAVGRSDEAWAILTQYLARQPDNDKAYAVLVQIPHPDRMSFLDRLYARDQFEERPLIWKASLLLKEGKLDEAEALARQALKVDPTDGEQPTDDRVRGYAVLADILTAKGKTEDAEFFYKVVKSVRIAEEGDEMNCAGLTTRSLKLYAEAETYFADAYCVQWRLAERLQALGKSEEAQKHYQIAFERMPEQFGQVASLCFGCEGIFDSAESRGAAEIVLTRLATNAPARAAVYYLLGQLREEQKRYPEAYAEYKKAVELDPGYLDVWEQIDGLREHLQLSADEWNAIQLRMLRLDPFERHISLRLDHLTDMQGFWTVRTEALGLNLPQADNLLPLTANAESLAKLPKLDMDSSDGRMGYGYYDDILANLAPPGESIAKHPFWTQLDSVQSMLGLSRRHSRSGRYFGGGFDWSF